MPPPWLVIYNPVAGRGRAAAQWPQVEQALRAASVAFDVAPTSAPLDGVRLARAAQTEGKYTGLIAVGGDGTVHEIVNGLLLGSREQETLPLAVVPLGSGDDFAKVIPPFTPIGGKAYDLPAAVRKIAQGTPRPFDVGRILGDRPRPELGPGPQYFCNGMDVGFGAQVALDFVTIPRFLTGVPAYFIAILKTMLHYFIPHLTIRLDDAPPLEQGSTMTAITNGRCFAGAFWVSPDALPDDGLFDVMIAGPVNRRTILGLIPKFMKGTHVREPVIRMTRAARIIIDSVEPLAVEADGEMPFLEARHLEIELLPRKLRIMA